MTEKSADTREIPPNAASKSDVERVRGRVEDLGVPWHDAVGRAGLGRNVGFKLLAGTGSIGSLRKIDEWAAKEESKKPPAVRGQAKAAKANEWAALGSELAELDPEQFSQMLDGLRDLVKAKRLEGAAILKMFRANPDR